MARSTDKAGYVYVLTNPSMPGLVKIGRTVREPSVRVRELTQSTNMPTPFRLRFHIRAADAVAVEASVHALLKDRRVRRNREFFRVGIEEAEQAVRSVAGARRLKVVKAGRRRPDWLIGALCLFAWANLLLWTFVEADKALAWTLTANALLGFVIPAKGLRGYVTSLGRHPILANIGIATIGLYGLTRLDPALLERAVTALGRL
jgi:hypothetical protein